MAYDQLRVPVYNGRDEVVNRGERRAIPAEDRRGRERERESEREEERGEERAPCLTTHATHTTNSCRNICLCLSLCLSVSLSLSLSLSVSASLPLCLSVFLSSSHLSSCTRTAEEAYTYTIYINHYQYTYCRGSIFRCRALNEYLARPTLFSATTRRIPHSRITSAKPISTTGRTCAGHA